DAGAVAGLHIISRIDQAEADTAGYRRNDVAVTNVELLLIDLRLIELHRALVLLHDVDLILVLLAGYRILFGQFLVAREIDLRLGEQALIARQLALVLGLQKLVGSRVDLRQKVVLLDHLPFGEADLHELTVDLRLHGDGRDRRHGSEGIHYDADIALADRCSADRLRHLLLIARAGGRLPGMDRTEDQIGANNDPNQDDQPNDNATSAADPALDDRRGHGSAKIRRRLIVRSARSLVHIGISSIQTSSVYNGNRHASPNENSLMSRWRRSRVDIALQDGRARPIEPTRCLA